MEYREIEGNLIYFAKEGEFDVIAHGCNCFCTMGAGLAPQMAKEFEAHQTPLEDTYYKGDINKLGQIDYFIPDGYEEKLIVVNAYTQYHPGANLDYDALRLCLRKMNHIFKGKHIGLPQIGCGIAGGVWEKNWRMGWLEDDFVDVKTIIQQELKDCDVTIVIYKK